MQRWLTPRPMLVVLLFAALAACQSSGTGTSPSAGPASPNSAATPTATPLPLVLPRPTDIPTDGTCDQDHICLGLLAAGETYRTRAFEPKITFMVPSSGWENVGDEGAVFQLLPITAPGDAIAFFRGARAVAADGSIASADETVAGLSDWLTSNPLLDVTPATAVSVGGLSGLTMDIRIAAGAASRPPSCHVQTCVLIFKGQDLSAAPPWHWDWESDGPEIQRLYLLTASDGVVVIFVDSLDGTTFDVLTTEADQILKGLTFG